MNNLYEIGVFRPSGVDGHRFLFGFWSMSLSSVWVQSEFIGIRTDRIRHKLNFTP